MSKFLLVIAALLLATQFGFTDEPRLFRANFALVAPAVATSSPVPTKVAVSTDRYAECWAKAKQEGKIMVVFVNTLPQRFEGVVSYRTDHFTDAQNKAIVVGVPVGDSLYRLDFGPFASHSEIMSRVEELRRSLAVPVQTQQYVPQQTYSSRTLSAAECRT